MKNKKGSEIMQTIIVIAVIGTIAITIVATFMKKITSSVGGKVKDSEWQVTAKDNMQTIKNEMKNNDSILLDN